jgi:hypothetical protein
LTPEEELWKISQQNPKKVIRYLDSLAQIKELDAKYYWKLASLLIQNSEVWDENSFYKARHYALKGMQRAESKKVYEGCVALMAVTSLVFDDTLNFNRAVDKIHENGTLTHEGKFIISLTHRNLLKWWRNDPQSQTGTLILATQHPEAYVGVPKTLGLGAALFRHYKVKRVLGQSSLMDLDTIDWPEYEGGAK